MTTTTTMRWMGVACAVVLAASMTAVGTELPNQHTSKKKSAKTHKLASRKPSQRASLPNRSADPYLGSIVVDAATGQVLLENNADAKGFPASVTKLMDMMVLLDKIQAGQISPTNMITVTAEAAKVGGTQVWLADKEVFPLEDLMYALMIQSANDAAVAMALHVAGSKEGFVELMNQKASQLGMTNSVFYSVHGLPPAVGQNGDTSTPRDLAKLACALVAQHPDILKYTSTRERPFRAGQPHEVIMRNHNHLLNSLAGCDGLKTGFITAGGFSIVATAQRQGRRVIAVVLGSRDRKVRDARAAELVNKGFAALPPLPPPPPPPVATNSVTANLPPVEPVTAEPPPAETHTSWLKFAGIGLAIGVVLLGVVAAIKHLRPREF